MINYELADMRRLGENGSKCGFQMCCGFFFSYNLKDTTNIDIVLSSESREGRAIEKLLTNLHFRAQMTWEWEYFLAIVRA